MNLSVGTIGRWIADYRKKRRGSFFLKSNIRHSTNELLNYIELHLNGASYQQLCEDYGLNLSRSKLRMYVQKYLRHGVSGLLRRQNNRHYSKELKHQVVQEYLLHNDNYYNLTIKYKIRIKSKRECI